MARGNLQALGALLDARRQASEAKLRRIRDREAALTALLETLRAPRRVPRLSDPGIAPIDFRNDIAHQRWVDQRRAAINTELAQVRALVDIARKDLQLHFARQRALRKLIDRQVADTRRVAQRRSDYGF